MYFAGLVIDFSSVEPGKLWFSFSPAYEREEKHKQIDPGSP